MLRHGLCWITIAVLPLSMMAADIGTTDVNAAMVYASGPAWINGSTLTQSSSAIFPGDMVQTKPGSEAKINLSGSSARILQDSLVQYEGKDLLVEQGGVNVGTSQRLATRAGAVTITPSSSAWTQFEVKHLDGEVQIVAIKGDVNVSTQSTTSTVTEGQQTTASDATGADQTTDTDKKKRRKKGGAATPGEGGVFNKTSALILAGAAGGTVGVIIWAKQRGPGEVSPANP